MQIGLDIGRQYAKIVVLEKLKDGVKLLNYDNSRIPETNKPFDPENIDNHLIIMAVKDLIKKLNLKPKNFRKLTTAISGSNSSLKQITAMDLTTDELNASMMFEARKHVPMDGTDAVIDFQVLGPNKFEADKIDLVLAACTKRARVNHTKLLKDIGIKPSIIDTEPIAVLNAYLQSNQLSEEGAVVLLDIGAISTSLVVWGEQDLFFTRDIPRGVHDLVKNISMFKSISYMEADDLLFKEGIQVFTVEEVQDDNLISLSERSSIELLIEDIRRTLRFYTKNSNQSFFTSIYLCGGGCNIKGLTEYIEKTLQIKTQIFNPFINIQSKNGLEIESSGKYAVATGLALRSGIEA